MDLSWYCWKWMHHCLRLLVQHPCTTWPHLHPTSCQRKQNAVYHRCVCVGDIDLTFVCSVIFVKQTVCSCPWTGLTDNGLVKQKQSLWLKNVRQSPFEENKSHLRQSQMVKIPQREHSIQLWIFKTLFNKRFKDTEEHSKVNKLHRYITITSARFSLVY